jgi:hypothetical protein
MTRRRVFKLLFHGDLMMPFVSAVFFFMTLISVRDYGLKLSDLDQYNGVFSSCDSIVIKVIDKPLFKQVTQRLNLKLENIPYNFTIQTTKDFGYLTSKIKEGDSLFIWTKTKKTDLAKTNSIAINHLIVHDSIIIDFYKTFGVSSKLIIFSLIPALGFLIWYYFKIKKRLRNI